MTPVGIAKSEKYEVYPDNHGQWRWRFVGANGKNVASGEAYHNKSGVLGRDRSVEGLLGFADY